MFAHWLLGPVVADGPIGSRWWFGYVASAGRSEAHTHRGWLAVPVQGYNRFCRIDMLSREEYIGADRSVSFRYYVRAPTYMQRSHDQVRVSVCAARPHRYCATVPTLTDAQQPTVEC